MAAVTPEPVGNNNSPSFFGRMRQDSQKRATLYNDAVLLLSLAYSALDLLLQWSDFKTCQEPVGTWLLGSYLMVSLFRILHYIAQWSSPNGEEEGTLLQLRQEQKVPKAVAYLTWVALLPCFAYWTVIRSLPVWPLIWSGSHDCLPEGAHPAFLVFCIILCHFWTLLYGIYFLGIVRYEVRLLRAEANLRSIETPDSIERWGRMSFLEGQGHLPADPATTLAKGLTPAEIGELPQEKLLSGSDMLCGECAICISGFHCGDKARRLPGCKHTFHKECIDLWLLRSAACPLCKSEAVRPMP